MKWINVKDRLPDNEGKSCFVPCLIYTHADRMIKGMYNTKTLHFLSDAFCNISIVTHWMPLPEPPSN